MKQDNFSSKVSTGKMSFIQRLLAPTPRFFRIVRNVGLLLAAVSGAFLTTPIVLPSILTTIAGYVAIAGSVMMAVSQLTVENSETKS